MRKAIEDYNMIDDGDRICVGVSGGKDSLALLAALSNIKRYYPKKFDLVAITLDMGYEEMDFSKVEDFAKELGVEYILKKTNIKEVVFDIRNESNPCSLCAKMRRGALNDAALEAGCKKVALGHHNNDVLETFYLSLVYEGRVNCFSPVTFLDRTGLYLIRPMIYVDERDIKGYVRRAELPVVHNPCCANGNTKRQEMKELISEMNTTYKGFKTRLFTAISNSKIDGWEKI